MTGIKLNELCFLILVMSSCLLFWHSPNIVKDDENINEGMYQENEEKPDHNEEINIKQIIAQGKEKDYLDITKPTIVYWTDDYNSSNDIMQYVHSFGDLKCDVIMNNYRKRLLPPDCKGAYIFYGSSINFTSLPLPRNPEKVIWVLWHEESPKNVAQLSHEKVLNLFNFSSTFSRYSDIPFTLQYLKSIEHITDRKYFVETSAKNKALKELSPILYMQSICDTLTQRDEYVLELMKYQFIDSYGNCLKNKYSPEFSYRKGYDYLNNLWDENLMKFIARYKFMITIENGVCDDYISEKIWRAIHAGVVPIYFGSPTIRDWLPNEKSAILIEDFPKPKLLSHHLNKLLDDDDLYEEYLEHKTMGKISNKNLLEEIKARPYQTSHSSSENELLNFLCEKLHKKDNSVNIVTQRHYNCPKPVTVLTQKVDPNNVWFGTWLYGEESAANLYDTIMQ